MFVEASHYVIISSLLFIQLLRPYKAKDRFIILICLYLCP